MSIKLIDKAKKKINLCAPDFATREYVNEMIADIPKAQPDYNASEGEEGYILNRPGYKRINPALHAKVDRLEVGNYCLINFEEVDGDYVNYLKYDEMIRQYNRTYDYYIVYDMVMSSGKLFAINQRVAAINFKKLDEENCYRLISSQSTKYTVLYFIHNRDLLSDELKEKITNNGVWLIVTGEQAVNSMINFEFIEYMFTKFEDNLMSKNTAFTWDLANYATIETINNLEARIAALEAANS